MSTTQRLIHAPQRQVWNVLADGWLYPLWVVGTTRVRHVDDHWPHIGTKIHHSIGIWPLLIDDTTRVESVDTGHHLELRARGWPLGEASVDIRLNPHGADTLVTLTETIVSGPGALVPAAIAGVLFRWRNTEALRRLAHLAEGRHREPR